MRYFLNSLFWAVIVIFLACNRQSAAIKSEKERQNYPDLKAYFNKEIQLLDSINPAMHKTITEGDEPVDSKPEKPDWKEELAIFETLYIADQTDSAKYEWDIDSSGDLKIMSWISRDTNTEVQRVAITYKKENIELIEAFLKKRSFVVDRDTRISYQPQKGYGIQMNENYIWSKPKRKEIFVELEPGTFLRK